MQKTKNQQQDEKMEHKQHSHSHVCNLVNTTAACTGPHFTLEIESTATVKLKLTGVPDLADDYTKGPQ